MMKSASSQFILKMAFGHLCVFLTITLFVKALGLVPNTQKSIIEGRVSLAESIAINGSALITQNNLKGLQESIRVIVKQNRDIVSVGLRNHQGELVFSYSQYNQDLPLNENSKMRQDNFILPLFNQDNVWGQVELKFTSIMGAGVLGGLGSFELIVLVLCIGSFIWFCSISRNLFKWAFKASSRINYLKKNFESMVQPVVIINKEENVIFANFSFLTLTRLNLEQNQLWSIGDLHWVSEKLETSTGLPWQEAIRTGQPQLGVLMGLVLNENKVLKGAIHCLPISEQNDILIIIQELSDNDRAYPNLDKDYRCELNKIKKSPSVRR